MCIAVLREDISCSGHVCSIVKCCNWHFILAGDMAGVACRGLVCVCVLLEKWQRYRDDNP